MTKPVVVFPDPMLWAVTFLRSFLASREETYADGVTVGTRPPADGSVPFVMVRLYGGSVDRLADSEALLRVTVWHSTDDKALALAELCRAGLDAFAGDADARLCRSLTAPFPADDPDNGQPISSFTAAARMRPPQS